MVPAMFADSPPLIVEWPRKICSPEWKIYDAVMKAALHERIPFALGGAFALATYTGTFRNTKDLDLYVLPQYRERMKDLVTRLGLVDYFDHREYDRSWIYRATADGVIVDTIWAMANGRSQVDEWWMSGPEIEVRGYRIKVIPAEVMLWDKLYILQRERCDWPGVMNILYAMGRDLDWDQILRRLGEDVDLLAGALSVFRWISPAIAQQLPKTVWRRVGLLPPRGPRLPSILQQRVSWLDRRPWYAINRRQDAGA
jgi:hypothetical protein